MTHPLIIIGAGPAGLAAAIAFGKGALILEKNPEAGKKLLISGSGQCNFTNNQDKAAFITACRKAGPFLKPALYQYDNEYFIGLLAKHGCPSLIREDGKVFPSSLKAAHVRDTLLQIALSLGAKIIYSCPVLSVQRQQTGFLVLTSADKLVCKKLIIACGGSSWNQTGSEGDGYAFAASLGHKVNLPRPALAAVETNLYNSFVHSAGSTISQITVDFITSHNKHRDKGDLLFTHRGLSGPVILNNSYLLQQGDKVRLHLVPDAELQVPELLKKQQNKLLINALKPLPITEALTKSCLHHLGMYSDDLAATVNRKQLNKLISFLQAAEFVITKVESLETCMATAGGVVFKEIQAITLQSRLVSGLFFAGELLDYALPTGGYNIQIAFSTGSLAGYSARSL